MGKVTEQKIDQLIPDDKNFNKGTEYGNSLIEKSLRKFGAGRSVLIDKNNRIIAGNKTIENASAIGMEDVIVVETDGKKIVAVKRTDLDLDSKEARELALADNQTSAVNFSIDEEVLKDVAEEMQIDLDEWGIVLDEEAPQSHEDDFDEDKEHVETRCKRGDVWQLGEHRLMCGDSTSAEDCTTLMAGDKADLVFTDPPYGVSIGNKNATLNAMTTINRIERGIVGDDMSEAELHEVLVKAMTNVRLSSKDDASYYVTSPQGGSLGLMMMMMMRDAGLTVRHMLIWCKNCATFSLGQLDYDYQHEPIFYTWTKSHHNYRGGAKSHNAMALRQTKRKQDAPDHETD